MTARRLLKYQQQLLDHLAKGGWELVLIETPGEDDVSDIVEQWTIRSVHIDRGCTLHLSFVYLHYFWNGIVASPERSIDVSIIMSDSFGLASDEPHRDIAVLNLGKGNYSEAVKAFVQALSDWRSERL